jgi:hypothetical protein
VKRLIEYGLSLVVAAVLVWWALSIKAGSPGWVRVRSHEVAVVTDYLSKKSALVASPGVRWFVPYFQDVHVIDKSPSEFRMHGEKTAGDRDVPRLEVRASDGTRFHFEDLTLRYQVVPGQAELALKDCGSRERSHFELVRALVRGVLADEFGRYSPEQIVDADTIDLARQAARERINARLAPHGLLVGEIPASTPRFDEAYEQQGLRRRVAEQQITLIGAERIALAMEREQRLTKAAREVDSARARAKGELEGQRIAAQTKALEARASAERYSLERASAAQRERAAREASARGRQARYKSEAEGFAEQVRAVGARGDQAVREAWIEALGRIELDLAPYERSRESAQPVASGAKP